MVLEGSEHEALEAKKGLWADLQPVPPWEWWKRKGRCRAQHSKILNVFGVK
jgi:hypothetical protein